MNRKIHFDIGGMTCINCQNKIEKALRGAKGVTKAEVSYRRGTADVEYDDVRTNADKLVRVIENLDYKVLSSGEKNSRGIINSFGILVIIAALYYLLQTFGLLNRLVPNRLADTGMGYGMLFVIGLITSVHCVAMCGGIGLSQSLPTKGQSKSLFSTILYNLGRVCSYTAIGFVLGLIGSVIGGGANVGVPVLLQGILKIIAGLVMVIMGINMLGIFPWLRRFSIHMPAGVAKFIGQKTRTSNGPFIVGLLNGLMPCGPLQAMWIVAFASADPVSGALSMLMFSLGTVPLMLGLGSVVSLLGRKFTNQVMKVGAVLVVVLGLAMLTQGSALAGIRPVAKTGSDGITAETEPLEEIPEDAASETSQIVAGETTAAVGEATTARGENVTADGETETAAGDTTTTAGDTAGEVQVIKSELTRGQYPEITVKAGVPVHWVIDAPAENINGCNGVMIIPDYEIQHVFEPGENVIEFTPTEAGVFGYSCWMGMVFGSINVVE